VRHSDCGHCVEDMFDFAVLDGDADPCVPSWRSRSDLTKRYIEEYARRSSGLAKDSMDESSGVFGERLPRDIPPELADRDRGSKVREE
jgi:hypothetical protein